MRMQILFIGLVLVPLGKLRAEEALGDGAPEQSQTGEEAVERAEEAGATDAESREGVSREQIRGWVADLASDDFAVRDAATENLVAAHAAAMDAVLEAKQSDDFEVSARAEAIRQRIVRRAMDELLARGAEIFRRNTANPESFSWKGREFTEQDLRNISCLRSVSRLTINDSPLTDDQLAYLRPLADVGTLDLAGTKVTNAGLVHLQTMTNLGALRLKACAITDEGLPTIGKMKCLRTLTLSETQIGDAGMAHVARLPKLKQLWLFETKVSGAGLEHLKPLAGQVDLLAWSGVNVQDDDLLVLRQFPGLTHLYLKGSFISGAGLVHLKNLPNLHWLTLTECPVTDEALEHLNEFPVLSRVNLSGTRVTSQGLFKLRHVPKLTSISVPKAFSDEELAELKRRLNAERLGPKISVSRN